MAVNSLLAKITLLKKTCQLDAPTRLCESSEGVKIPRGRDFNHLGRSSHFGGSVLNWRAGTTPMLEKALRECRAKWKSFMWVPTNSRNRSENCGFRIAHVVRHHSSGTPKMHKHKEFQQKPPTQTLPPGSPWSPKLFMHGASLPFKIENPIHNFRGGS